jgi:predicted ATPase
MRNYPEDKAEEFPWSLSLVKDFEELVFEKSVSFFVGENGSGKSTILEGIAAYSEIPIAGSYRLEEDDSLAAANELANYLSIRYKQKSQRGFFVRAEDFIGFARHIKNEIKALDKEIEEVKESFTSRITGTGLYLIDEPEAALSPSRQLSLLSLIKEKVEKTGSHFIIATHSPIIMALPDSEIFYFSDNKIEKVSYTDTEHYKLSKAILDNPAGIFDLI